MKNEIIKNLPEISKSSNYAPKKLDHQLNHRSVVRELEEWLKQKLKNPPQNYEESVEYKNMIMGIGMKELIRIISKRCSEEGRIAEEIWELTWSICR